MTTTTITTNDLVALRIQFLQNHGISDIQIVNNTDVDEFTKIVNMTYTYHYEGIILPLDDYSYREKT